MLRRQFISGLLCAPALVRASSLDALPRGVPLRSGQWDAVRLGVGDYVLFFDARPGDLVIVQTGTVFRIIAEAH